MASTTNSSSQNRKKGPKLTKDGKITVFDVEDTSYGIRELIDLIRYIPDGQDVFFGAEMIKKTLASMQLSIHDIMQDGVEKRKLAAKTIQHLVAEIADYQRRIQSLKGHIRHLRFELGEIQDTCHYLITDDTELSQYQAILEEVPRSPIEGSENDDQRDEAPSSNDAEQVSEQPAQESTASSNLPEPDKASTEADKFEANETQVTDENFMPDALVNAGAQYQSQDPDHLPTLTDEVFDPDRFDDQNGLDAQQAKAAFESRKDQRDQDKTPVSEIESEQTPAAAHEHAELSLDTDVENDFEADPDDVDSIDDQDEDLDSNGFAQKR